jgi:hypothetical protein
MTGRRGESLRRIEREIASEKAAALGRAGERLEQVLNEAREAAARLLAANDDDCTRRAQEYAAIRARALEARLALLIQREALGLRRHATVDQQFPEPPHPEYLLRRKHRGNVGLEPGTS